MADTVAKRVRVSGTVQGVFFRATTRDEARQRDVAGWVENLEDGRVRAHFEGDPTDVDAMVAFCGEGPPAADVADVEISEAAPEGLETFEVRR